MTIGSLLIKYKIADGLPNNSFTLHKYNVLRKTKNNFYCEEDKNYARKSQGHRL